jgi:Putative Flp pilus-assembly TadE/G-like
VSVTVAPDRSASTERGQVAVFFALLIPVLLGLIAIVIGIGNWYVHGKHLQTKADAGAFAGGSVWAFPCGPQIDAAIEAQARLYAGSKNPQVGGVPDTSIHTVLNGPAWYDDDDNPSPTEWTSPISPNGSVCAATTLDVKVTEDNSFPLASLIPLFPDIKRKARIEIQEAEGISGVLPIAVRVPKPASAAAIFIDERPLTKGTILARKYMCENNGIAGVPTGLGGWTTLDVTNTQGPGGTSLCPDWADFNVPTMAGVVIALSFRPACPDPNGDPCMDLVGSPAFTNVNQICNQTTPSGVSFVQCFYATGSGSSQTTESGLQFIRGWSAPTSDNAPELASVWLDTASGTNCGPNPAQAGGAYFSAPVVNSCTATLHANVDAGPATPGNTEVRYKLVAGNTSAQDDDPPGACGNNYQPECELNSGSATVTLDPAYARHAFAIQVRLRFINNPVSLGLPAECANDYNNNCRWFFTGAVRTTTDPTDPQIFNNPVQRSFMGDIDLSGSIKWLRLVADTSSPCDGTPEYGLGNETGEAASVPAGNRCFYLDMGVQGAVPDDQDVYPIAFNLSTTSQHQLLDCDPNIPQGQVDDAVMNGCGPWYAAHDFIQTPLCPDPNSIFNLPQPPPWQNWDPKTCVKTRPTASGNQLRQGFNGRIFGMKNNPNCPGDAPGFQRGRNYWNDANNLNDTVTDPDTGATYDTTFTEAGPIGAHDNFIPRGDPRLVTLFFTPYQSFGNQGQETYPIVGLGQFYITGWGRAGNVDDPCTGGNTSGIPGAGNLPPPDLPFGNNFFVWGHFIKGVILGGPATPSGVACDPDALQPCVPILVE